MTKESGSPAGEMGPEQVRNIIEAALLAAERPLNMDAFLALFETTEGRPGRDAIQEALDGLRRDYDERGIELAEVASGYRVQVRQAYARWIQRLWSERPVRYSRALLETLALIAYRQPITRGEIEDIRGVSVSSSIVRTLMEREWIHVVGHRDVPGRPAMYGTTRGFLDHFNLKSLGDLPSLAELQDLDDITRDLFKEPAADKGREPADPESQAGSLAVSESESELEEQPEQDDPQASALITGGNSGSRGTE